MEMKDEAIAALRAEAGRAAELDRQLGELMGVVRLGYLLEREGGWEAVQEWGEVLSLGESPSGVG